MTPPLAQGQASTYARLVGTVRDQTGAVIPGVEFTATARATNASRSTITDDRGDYILDKLIPGQYDGLAELSGFKTQVLLDFRLEVTQVARQDFEMAPGEIAEQVTVRGQSTIIDTDNAEVGAVIEEKKIQDRDRGAQPGGSDVQQLSLCPRGQQPDRQVVSAGGSPLQQRRYAVRPLQLAANALDRAHKQPGCSGSGEGRDLPSVSGPVVPGMAVCNRLGKPYRVEPGNGVHGLDLEVRVAGLSSSGPDKLAPGVGLRRWGPLGCVPRRREPGWSQHGRHPADRLHALERSH